MTRPGPHLLLIASLLGALAPAAVARAGDGDAGQTWDGGALPADGGAAVEGDGGAEPAPALDEAASPAPAPPAAAASPAPSVPSGPKIAAYEVAGELIDPPGKLLSLARSVAPEGSPFIEAGPADEIGEPIGTIPRLAKALSAVGYTPVVIPRRGPTGVTLRLELRALDRVRYVFVSGNRFRVRQDEIQRRISIRPGRPLPPPGPPRNVAIERERQRIVDFLRGEGFREANATIDLAKKGGVGGPTDVHVNIGLGPGYPLGRLQISGNRVVPDDEIEKLFRHADPWKLGLGPAPFTVKAMRQDVELLTKRYRALGFVGVRVSAEFNPERDIDYENKRINLSLVIRERKRIQVGFEGNDTKSASALREQLTLYERGSYDDYEAGASAEALERYYQQDGYFFARVAWRRERLSANEDRLVFSVAEGPRLKVRGVEFAGNQALPSSELAEVVTVREFPLLGAIGLGAGGFVTARQVELDAERLVEHYRSKGFPEAKAHGEIATSRDDFGKLTPPGEGAEARPRIAQALYVRFTVQEGPRVFLASEDFRTADGGPLPYDRRFLLESVALRPGQPYLPQTVRQDGKRLERLLGDAGFPNGSADPELVREGDKVKLTWVLTTGPRTVVGPTFVRGNFVTQDDTILEQIPLETGRLLTTTGVERGQRNLGFMQLFNNANPISFPGREEGRPVVPMVVDVEERYDQYSVIHLGAGASTEQAPPGATIPIGVYLRAGYENRNLLGQAWNLTSQATYGTSLFRGNATFLDRRFFGSLFRFDVSLNYLSQATVRLGQIRSGGGSIGFSRQLAPGVDAGIHYNLRNTTHTESLTRRCEGNCFERTATIGTTVGSISANIEWLRLDNRLVPTRGFKVEGFVELALPALSAPLRALPFAIGDDTFLKVGARSATIIPLTRKLFLRHGLRIDHGIPLGGPSMLPKVERYFAGGDTTIRGYKLDRARIEEVAIPIGAGIVEYEYRPLGGNVRIIQNIDLQFPISGAWYGAVFMDNGVVADSLDGLTASRFRHSVGVSPLLLRLPIGDLSFSWAWPLDPGPGDTKIGVFHVNIGLLF